MFEKPTIWVPFSWNVVETVNLFELLSHFEIMRFSNVQVLGILAAQLLVASFFREYFCKIDVNERKYLMNFESVLKISSKFRII